MHFSHNRLRTARRLWLRAVGSGVFGPITQRRFIDYFTAYTNAVVEEVIDRDAGVYRRIEDYFAIRRDTLGFRPLYSLMVLELPDAVVRHPLMVEMETCVIDMLIIDNVRAQFANADKSKCLCNV